MLSDFYHRLFRQNERVMKFGLAAISAALDREPQICSYPHISVAGTNGKGQVSALLANAAYLLGFRTGLFTSPHLVDFRERMRINGRLVSEHEIATIGMQVLSEYGGDPVPEFSGITLTYFECCLMMALRLFKSHDVNFGIFEVGLGGRLDATNALNPALTVITSISLDHEQYLGHTTAEIAREKAGMMRAGCPVIVGRQETEVLQGEAQNRECSSFDALGLNFDWRENHGRVELVTQNETIALPGAEKLVDYQRDNLAVAVFALLKSEEIGLLPHGIRNLLHPLISNTRWVGRMWPCSKETAQKYHVDSIIMDGAHNPDGVRAFCHAVSSLHHDSPKALIVNSCRDKSLEMMFPQYLNYFDQKNIFIVPVGHTERACQPEEYCERLGLDLGQVCRSLEEGLQRSAESVGNKGIIYISGSLYLIGEAIQVLGETQSLETIYIKENDMINADEALAKLKSGHQKYIDMEPIPAPTKERLLELATHGQHPFAVVVTCSDSRVVPEMIFHSQPGDLFTIRTAGQVISNIEMGSIEYAVDHLHTRLIVVLGHSHCGAVHGACEPHEHCSCHLGALLSLVEPSVEKAKAQCSGEDELIAKAEDLNIENMMKIIADNPALNRIKDLKIVGAKYDIEPGEISYWCARS